MTKLTLKEIGERYARQCDAVGRICSRFESMAKEVPQVETLRSAFAFASVRYTFITVMQSRTVGEIDRFLTRIEIVPQEDQVIAKDEFLLGGAALWVDEDANVYEIAGPDSFGGRSDKLKPTGLNVNRDAEPIVRLLLRTA